MNPDNDMRDTTQAVIDAESIKQAYYEGDDATTAFKTGMKCGIDYERKRLAEAAGQGFDLDAVEDATTNDTHVPDFIEGARWQHVRSAAAYEAEQARLWKVIEAHKGFCKRLDDEITELKKECDEARAKVAKYEALARVNELEFKTALVETKFSSVEWLHRAVDSSKRHPVESYEPVFAYNMGYLNGAYRYYENMKKKILTTAEPGSQSNHK